ncbi:MAG: ribosome small subunit-dependent GTPase A, partial [Fulvivirga sp.]|nr:ribosome small subunit-dependent GTPase A [Fulvivirga sp.]
VEYEKEQEVDAAQGIIVSIHPRENYIIRKSVKKTGHAHIIAANIDQAMLIATMTLPRTSYGFIDRFLVAAEAFRIPQVLVFNKIDLLDEKDAHEQSELIKVYEDIGVTCLEISAREMQGLEAVEKQLDQQVTLISGHSGVGKSTLLNKLDPSINQAVKEVSTYAEKGVHTTTFAEMFQLNENTFVIDTPGIKELGLIDTSQEELSDYFPEMRAIQSECKFYNCSHIHEPKCAVKEAVEAGEIAEKRYNSYLSMYHEEDTHR